MVRRSILCTSLLALLATGPVLGCGTSEPAGDERQALHATVERSRLFETQRQLKLVLRNDGLEAVTIDSVQLVSPRFVAMDAQARRSVLGPGRSVSMPLDFGDSSCGDAADEGEAVVVVEAEGKAVELPFDEPPRATLAELHAQECEIERIRAAASISFDESFTVMGPREVRAMLELRQVEPGRAVVVESLRGSVIFTVIPDRPAVPLLAVGPDRPTDAVAVTVGASRCDPHALIESKRTYLFSVWARLDDGEVVRLDVEPEGALRDQLEVFLDGCR